MTRVRCAQPGCDAEASIVYYCSAHAQRMEAEGQSEREVATLRRKLVALGLDVDRARAERTERDAKTGPEQLEYACGVNVSRQGRWQ